MRDRDPEDEVLVEIRERYAAGETQTRLAKEYGLLKVIISLIVRGEIYIAAGGPITRDRVSRKLEDHEVIEMRELYAEGTWTYQELASKYDLSSSVCGIIIKGTAYQDVGGPRTRLGPTITAEEAEEIRTKYAEGDYTQKALGKEYGISQSDIGAIVRGEKWEVAGGPTIEKGSRKNVSRKGGGSRSLSNDDAMGIIIDYHYRGVTISDLARQYDIDYSAIKSLVTRQTYKDVDVPIFSQPDREQISGLYQQGMSVGRIAAMYQAPIKVISAAIKEHGGL